MANTFKKVIDRQMWVPVAPGPNIHAAGGGLCSDLRNSVVRNPFVYNLASATVLNRFNFITKGWQFVVSPALAGTFGAGSGSVFAPSAGIRGSIGAGCTTTSIVTTTSITSVGTNMLANRGGSGDYGFKIRIIGNSAAGSGLIQERWIVGNTSGTTPTFLLDSALTFTPANGDTYEILSGSVYMLNAGTVAAGSWRSYETAANTLTSRSTTNLTATISTECAMVCIDEQYVPYDHNPGEGFVTSTTSAGTLACLVATTTGTITLTGMAAGGDASVLQNEYRNFQIRIVEDTAKPTAVNQRAIIASHTAGASPVYTLGANWGVVPSPTAKYVIEYPNLILMRTNSSAVVYTYNYNTGTVNNGTNSILTDAWHVTYFGNGNACGAGSMWAPSFGIEPDAAKNARHSILYFFRGAGGANLDTLDIAGGTAGTWASAIVYDGGQLLTTGSCGEYCPFDNEGRFAYINFYTASAISQIFRFDVKNRVMSAYTPTDWIQAGTAAVGKRIASYCAIDGSDKYSVLLLQSHLAVNAFELIVQI